MEPADALGWMRRALELARRAASEGEVPVGAVVVQSGRAIGEGWNRSELLADPTGHAEILALRRAAATTRNHRLTGAVLVTTLEPCLMCLGAVLESRVEELWVAARDSRRGALDLWTSGRLASFPARPLRLHTGLEQEASQHLLQAFFEERRKGALQRDAAAAGEPGLAARGRMREKGGAPGSYGREAS